MAVKTQLGFIMKQQHNKNFFDMKPYKAIYTKTVVKVIRDAENPIDLDNIANMLCPDGFVLSEYHSLDSEEEIEDALLAQDISEFEENWQLFTTLLKKQPFFDDIKINDDNEITEPEHEPGMYNTYMIVHIAELCGLQALVVAENGRVVIKIS